MTRPLLYILFVLSGAAGLFYESVWSRYLSLFVGHGAYAQVIVLVIFLGGMALGAAVVSRVSARLRDPLYGYALVELGIGLLGLGFHDFLYVPVTEWAYDALFPALGGGFGVIAVKWILAGALILPQSVLLGATFPLMSAGVLRRQPGQPGTVLSWLYFANSLGAAAGVLVAGFYLVKTAGLPGTLIAAAIINLLVGLAALVVSKATAPGPVVAAPEAAGGGSEYPLDLDLIPRRTLGRMLLAVSAGTAIASFIYEVAWIRLLSLVLGSATHSFELMLSAFILGLALGAFWIRKRAETLRRPLLALAWVQVFMGMMAAASLALYEWSFYWTADLMSAVARTDQGYTLFTLARYAMCLVIMLPATFLAGMTLPLITRSLLVRGTGEAAIGAVYGANTAGSIVGAGIASLVVIPLVGLKGTLLGGAILDLLVGLSIGVVLLRHGAPVRQLVTRGALVAVLVPLVVGVGVRLDRALLSSGVFRTGQAAMLRDSVVFYRDGRTASVSATRAETGRLTIATNGKPDGSLDPVWLKACTPGDSLRAMTGDDPTQLLLPMITLAHRPDARAGAVIGHGTGMSSHVLLASPRLESLVTVEIEPVMVEASRVFYPANRRVFEDPRARHVFDDAKAYFAAANRRFDIIMAEPSNPWVSGVSGLFTEEFYRRVGRYLSPGGVLGQWLHTYELTDDLVIGVLTAIHRNFSDYAIYSVNLADLLIVATPEGSLSAPDWSVFGMPGSRPDLCHFHPITSRDLEAARLTTRRDLGPLLDQNRANSDFYPVLDLGAERARFLSRAAAGVETLFQGVYDFAGGPSAPRLPADTQRVSALIAIPRVRALVTGAALRAKYAAQRPDPRWELGPRDDVDGRVLLWLRSLQGGGEPPESWAVWTRSFTNGFDLWHAGTRGYLDSTFVAPVVRYLERHHAPEPVRATVRFRVGLAARDWASVRVALPPLLEEARARRYWLDPDPLREGGALALLALGRPDSAAEFFAGLDGHARRPRTDLRVRLFRSYLWKALQDP
ncbi:MAG TPA: hypothetical protein VGA42_10095 [Gemmatimonadales bacterium]